jgi:hypothetical protein
MYMDDSAQSINRSSSKNVSVDVQIVVNSISNANNAESISKSNSHQITTHTAKKTKYAFFFWCQIWTLLFFARKYWLFSTLSSIANPVFACCMFLSIAMLIGILVVCFTAPKQTGKSFLFYILDIEDGKSPK